MVKQPVVSVIMLAYNHEKYIAKAIRSVLEQETSFDYELLIGEDCSTDRTRDIIREFRQQYPEIIHPLYHKRNLGTTKNVYSVLRRAKGKYLAACEGDDFWCDPHRLQREVDFLEAHPEYVGINSGCRVVDEEDRIIPREQIESRLRFWDFSGQIYTLKDYEEWKMPGHGSALTRRNIYLDEALDYRITYQASSMVGDRTSTLLNLLYGNIYCSDRIVSCYRFRMAETSDNYMSKSRFRNLKDQDFMMMRRLERWCKEKRGIDLDLSIPKKDRLAGSVVIWMKDPNVTNFRVMKSIIFYSGTPLKYMGYVVRVCFTKLYYWYIKKDDAPVRL